MSAFRSESALQCSRGVRSVFVALILSLLPVPLACQVITGRGTLSKDLKTVVYRIGVPSGGPATSVILAGSLALAPGGGYNLPLITGRIHLSVPWVFMATAPTGVPLVALSKPLPAATGLHLILQAAIAKGGGAVVGRWMSLGHDVAPSSTDVRASTIVAHQNQGISMDLWGFDKTHAIVEHRRGGKTLSSKTTSFTTLSGLRRTVTTSWSIQSGDRIVVRGVRTKNGKLIKTLRFTYRF